MMTYILLRDEHGQDEGNEFQVIKNGCMWNSKKDIAVVER